MGSDAARESSASMCMRASRSWLGVASNSVCTPERSWLVVGDVAVSVAAAAVVTAVAALCPLEPWAPCQRNTCGRGGGWRRRR